MSKVFISYKTRSYMDMFEQAGYELTDSIDDADLVVFTGGADVSPNLYGQKVHRQTHYSVYRDDKDRRVFEQAQALRLPCVGICRGGQFLNVMNMGSMYQHVDNHVGDHLAFDSIEGDPIFVSSTHHQMMIAGDRGIPRLWAYEANVVEGMPFTYQYSCEARVHKQDVYDLEAVWYPETKCYCFQPHPEFDGYDECREFFFKEIKELIGV